MFDKVLINQMIENGKLNINEPVFSNQLNLFNFYADSNMEA